MTISTVIRSEQNAAQGLMTRHGQMVIALARMLAAAESGDRLLPVQEYAELFQAGAGTVQSALDYLQAIGAAQLEPRGRLGTYVAALDYVRLWQIGYQRSLIGSLPLPYSRHVEGLATALQEQFVAAGLGLTLRFTRGSTERLQALAQNVVDWALTSRFAAMTAGAHGFVVTSAVALGEYSYLAGHVLLLRDHPTASLRDGDRLGVDFLSADHTYISRAISRGKRVELVNIQYDQALDLLASGVIDAVVWTNQDVPTNPAGVAIVPLTADNDPALAALSEAVIVITPEHRAPANVLRAILDLPALLDTQRAVVNRARIPSY
jgi:hypothetical protein